MDLQSTLLFVNLVLLIFVLALLCFLVGRELERKRRGTLRTGRRWQRPGVFGSARQGVTVRQAGLFHAVPAALFVAEPVTAAAAHQRAMRGAGVLGDVVPRLAEPMAMEEQPDGSWALYEDLEELELEILE